MTRVPTCASSQLKRFRKSSGSTQQWRYEYRHEPSATSTRSRARGNQLRFLLRGRCSARWPAKGVDAKRGQALADVIGTIAPYVENGQVAGARIGRPGSLFRAVGIERGDVVVQVNGESLTSAQSVLQLRYVSRGSGRPDANRAGVHLKPRPRCGRMDRRGI